MKTCDRVSNESDVVTVNDLLAIQEDDNMIPSYYTRMKPSFSPIGMPINER